MFATFVFSALFLAFSGALIARLPLRAKLLPAAAPRALNTPPPQSGCS